MLIFNTKKAWLQLYINGLFESKKNERSRVEGGRVIQLPYLEVFYGRRGKSLEGFGAISTTFNPSFLIPPNWRDFEEE